MSAVNNEENKQSINNIKMLSKMSAEGLVPNLFREVKRVKEEAYSKVRTLREQIRVIKRQEEERARIEAIKIHEKRQKEFEEKSVPEQSFAELFAASNGEKVEKKISEENSNKEVLKKEIKVEEIKDQTSSSQPKKLQESDKKKDKLISELTKRLEKLEKEVQHD